MSTPAEILSMPVPAASPPPASSPPAASQPPGPAPTPAAPPAQPSANDAFWSKWTAPDQADVAKAIQTKGFTDPFALAKSYVELEKNVGTLRAATSLKGYPAPTVKADGTVVPPDPKAVQAWNLSQGVPDTADKYDIPVNPNNPYPQFQSMVQQMMHRNGVPPAMAKSLAEDWERSVVAPLEKAAIEADVTRSNQELAELEQQWGPAYKERVAIAARGKEWLASTVGGLSEQQMFQLTTTLGAAKAMQIFHTLGAANGEAGFPPGGNASPPGFGTSVAGAQAELDRITAERSAGRMTKQEFDKQAQDLVKILTDGMPPQG